MPKPPPPSSRLWKAWDRFTAAHIALYQRSGGRLGGRVGKLRMLLLHHVGRRTGTRRIAPLLYVADGDDVVIVASKGGSDRHPAWFHNLMAQPHTTVQIGAEHRRVRAREATPAERERLWPRLIAMYAPYRSYRTYTEREIPLVVLEPAP